jgi:hypothetical protein
MTDETKEPQTPEARQAGSFLLDCGHQQVVSSFRATIAADGLEQHKVWCTTCEEWARLSPDRGE